MCRVPPVSQGYVLYVSNKAMRRLGLGWRYSVLMILYVGADLDEEKRNPVEYCIITQDVIKEP